MNITQYCMSPLNGKARVSGYLMLEVALSLLIVAGIAVGHMQLYLHLQKNALDMRMRTHAQLLLQNIVEQVAFDKTQIPSSSSLLLLINASVNHSLHAYLSNPHLCLLVIESGDAYQLTPDWEGLVDTGSVKVSCELGAPSASDALRRSLKTVIYLSAQQLCGLAYLAFKRAVYARLYPTRTFAGGFFGAFNHLGHGRS